MAWTEEQKAAVIAEYTASKPTGDNSIELVKALAEKHGQSANGVRMVLNQAKVYVVKAAGAPATGKTATGAKAADGTTKAPRVTKESQIAALLEAIVACGAEADSEILDKLTGKAAAYFTGVLAVAAKAAAAEDEGDDE